MMKFMRRIFAYFWIRRTKVVATNCDSYDSWDSVLPKDIVRKIASISDASIRLVCKTAREGFDETNIKDKNYIIARGISKLSKVTNGQIIIEKKTMNIEVCDMEPLQLYNILVQFQKYNIEINVLNKPESNYTIGAHSYIPSLIALQRTSWWRDSKCSIRLVAYNEKFYRIVDMTI